MARSSHSAPVGPGPVSTTLTSPGPMDGCLLVLCLRDNLCWKGAVERQSASTWLVPVLLTANISPTSCRACKLAQGRPYPARRLSQPGELSNPPTSPAQPLLTGEREMTEKTLVRSQSTGKLKSKTLSLPARYYRMYPPDKPLG